MFGEERKGASPDLPSPFLFGQMMSDANEVRALSSPVNFFSTTHTGEPIIYEADFVNWGNGMLKRGGHITIPSINVRCTPKIASNCSLARKQSCKVKFTIKELCLEKVRIPVTG